MSLNKYELVLVLSPDLDDNGVNEQLEKVKQTISQHGGEITAQETWGRRQLNYEIKRFNQGIYVISVLTGNNQLVASLERQLRINELVLRHLIVKKDKFAPDAAPHLKEDPATQVVDLLGDEFFADDARI